MTPEHRQRFREVIRFQKALALAAGASNRNEAKAAEVAARKLMEAYEIDPVVAPNGSFYNQMNFADNALLKKLRDEWRAAHPDYWYKTSKGGHVRRLRGKPKRKRATPDPVNLYEGMFDDYKPGFVEPEPTAKTKPIKHQPSSDRSRDRHSPGYMRDYMRDYMRRRRAAQKRDAARRKK